VSIHPNIQFIYEIVIAERELREAGLEPTLLADRRTFDVPEPVDSDFVMRRCAYIESLDGQPTDYRVIQDHNQTGSPNQYLTHWFYPYKGKFHPQIIRALLNIIHVQKGDVLLDPFVGSGTAALEAQLLGVRCVAFDASPLCALMTRVKTRSWQHLHDIEEYESTGLAQLVQVATELDPKSRGIEKKDIDFTEMGLPSLASDLEPEELREFAHLAWLIALSGVARRKRDFAGDLQVTWDKMVASVRDQIAVKDELDLDYPTPDVSQGDARDLPLADESVDGIVTSPPYSIALNYVKNDKHALMAMGHDPDDIGEDFIGVRGSGEAKYALYDADLEESIAEMARVLRPGARCAIIIGNKTVAGVPLKTTALTEEYCRSAGLGRVDVIPKKIFGLYNIMQDEEIIIYTKPS
jgi:hypothetical protein